MNKIALPIALICCFPAFSQVPTTGLIAHYPLNGNGQDYSGNAFHGSTSAGYTADRFGNPNSALLLDGQTEYLNLNNDQPIINSSEFTISGWARMDGTGGGVEGQNNLFEQRDHDATQTAKSTILLMPGHWNSTSLFSVRSSSAVNAESSTVAVPAPTDGNWHHYVGVLEPDTIRLYIDGVEVAHTAFLQTGNFTTGIDHVNLGSHTHTTTAQRGLFNGALDDTRIYSRALSSQEVTALYNEANPTAGIPSVLDIDLTIYPNPTTDILYIGGLDEGNYTVTLYSMTGAFIESKEISPATSTVSLENYSDASFWIRISNEKGSVLKLVSKCSEQR